MVYVVCYLWVVRPPVNGPPPIYRVGDLDSDCLVGIRLASECVWYCYIRFDGPGFFKFGNTRASTTGNILKS